MTIHDKCPCCGKTLQWDQHNGQFIVWCGFGNCKSDLSNNPCTGETMDEAVEKFVDAVNGEMIKRENV